MTFDPSNVLFLGQRFFLPNLIAIGHSWEIWHLVDVGWPLRPHQCSTLRSGVLPIKFGNHRTFPCNLTRCWPRLTPAWHLNKALHYSSFIGHSWAIWPLLTLVDPCMTPEMHYSLVRDSFYTKFVGNRAFLKQLDLWMTFDLWWGRFENMLLNLVGPSPTPMPSSAPSSKHDETHSRTHLHTYLHTHRLRYSIDCNWQYG